MQIKLDIRPELANVWFLVRCGPHYGQVAALALLCSPFYLFGTWGENLPFFMYYGYTGPYLFSWGREYLEA
jgi:hypothetical protein